jgi:hypothetical protein
VDYSGNYRKLSITLRKETKIVTFLDSESGPQIEVHEETEDKKFHAAVTFNCVRFRVDDSLLIALPESSNTF